MPEDRWNAPVGTVHKFDLHRSRSFAAKTIAVTDDRVDYEITGTCDGKQVNGVLIVHLDAGKYNGYDWSGTKLSFDELQVILDLFETYG